VRQLVIKVLNIIDARCNHEVYDKKVSSVFAECLIPKAPEFVSKTIFSTRCEAVCCWSVQYIPKTFCDFGRYFRGHRNTGTEENVGVSKRQQLRGRNFKAHYIV